MIDNLTGPAGMTIAEYNAFWLTKIGCFPVITDAAGKVVKSNPALTSSTLLTGGFAGRLCLAEPFVWTSPQPARYYDQRLPGN